MFCALLQNGGATVIAATIATAVALCGWLGRSILGGTLHYLGLWGAEIERMIALKEEIAMNLLGQTPYADGRLLETLKTKYAADPGYRHFVPVTRENVVFDNIKKDITKLPEGPLGGVIEYYTSSATFDGLLAVLETERYESLSTDRKVEIYDRIIQHAGGLTKLGGAILPKIDAAIGRRRFYRSALFSANGAMIVVMVWLGMAAFDAVSGLPACAKASPTRTAGATGAVACQISGGRMGGLMMSSPSFGDFATNSISVREPLQSTALLAKGVAHGAA